DRRGSRARAYQALPRGPRPGGDRPRRGTGGDRRPPWPQRRREEHADAHPRDDGLARRRQRPRRRLRRRHPVAGRPALVRPRPRRRAILVLAPERSPESRVLRRALRAVAPGGSRTGRRATGRGRARGRGRPALRWLLDRDADAAVAGTGDPARAAGPAAGRADAQPRPGRGRRLPATDRRVGPGPEHGHPLHHPRSARGLGDRFPGGRAGRGARRGQAAGRDGARGARAGAAGCRRPV
ncbi:MAG: hypothetical protein AVDCRST_MAG73-1724, partial [uncultured Thermomicrobiales bacterium]